MCVWRARVCVCVVCVCVCVCVCSVCVCVWAHVHVCLLGSFFPPYFPVKALSVSLLSDVCSILHPSHPP